MTEAEKTKAAWLWRYRDAKARAAEMADDLAELRTLAEHITPRMGQGGGGKGPNVAKLAAGAERCMQKQEQLEVQMRLVGALYTEEVEALEKLGPEEKLEMAPEPAGMTVSEIKQMIAQRQGEQMTLLPDEPAPAVDEQQLRESILADVEAQYREQLDKAAKAAAALLKEQEASYERHRKEIKDQQESAKKRMKEEEKRLTKKAEAEKAAAVEQARKEQTAKFEGIVNQAKAASEAAARREAEAEARDAELANRLQLNASQDGVRFAMLFEDMQSKAQAMMDLADKLAAAGQTDEAAKYRRALAVALQALAGQMEV